MEKQPSHKQRYNRSKQAWSLDMLLKKCMYAGVQVCMCVYIIGVCYFLYRRCGQDTVFFSQKQAITDSTISIIFLQH